MKGTARVSLRVLAAVVVAGAVGSTVVGCGGEVVDDVPKTTAERIKAIENNPSYKPEEKEKYKKQVEETERLNAMLEKRSKEMPAEPKVPMPSR